MTGAGVAAGLAGGALAAALAAAPAAKASTAAESGSLAASDVVPDLMATPVFEGLKMPPLPRPAEYPQADDSLVAISMPGQQSGPGEPGSAADGGGPGPDGRIGRVGMPDEPGSAPGRPSGRWLMSRRGMAVLGPVAVSAVVAAGVFLAFPGVGDSLVRGLSRLTSGSGIGSSSASNARSGGLGRHSGGTAPANGSPGSSVPPAGHGTSATPTPSGTRGGSSPSGRPTPSAAPTASGSPSPATPSSSPSGGFSLPVGFGWQSESAATAGTTAGFRIATPAGWLMTTGVNTYFAPLVGLARVGVDMAPFAAQWPVREAKDLQASAIAHNTYPGYRLVSILATRYHGSAAASWTFSWKPSVISARIDVTALIFTAKTSAGPQPYVLSMSAPPTRAAWASRIFRVALKTFTPLP